MQKKTKAAILAICLITIIVVSIFIVSLQKSQRPQGKEYQALAEQLLGEAKKEFEQIRGVSVRDVTLEVVNKSWVIENWGKAYADPEIAEIHREENIYKELFMIYQNDSLYEAKLEWPTAYYAAVWMGKMYIIQENFDITNTLWAESTLVHELTHIIQENYSLPQRATFDGTTALTAFTEGDGDFMANAFTNKSILTAYSTNSYSTQSPPVSLGLLLEDKIQPLLPYTVDRLSRFPYAYGKEFVKTLYDTGGWNAVNQTYANPPTTTEQIMHPEKYFAQEDDKTVTAPTVNGGWNLTRTDQFGEYFIRVMLSNWLYENEAEQASQGWGGDVMNYYEKSGDFLFTWSVAWDSVEDAHEFYVAFQDMMKSASAGNVSSDCWFAYNRYLTIQWNGTSTLIVSSPDQSSLLSVGAN